MHKVAVLGVLLAGTHAAADSSVTVMLGDPVVTGAYDVKVLSRAVKPSQKRLVACYKKAQGLNAQRGATANATFTIEADGKVTNVAVDGLDVAAGTCLVGVFAKLKLPRPKTKEPVEVTYPVSFFAALAPTGALGSLTGRDVSSELDAAGDMQGGLHGGDMGDSGGVPGGPGLGTGTIGIGSIGTLGTGVGTGSGYGTGFGRRTTVPSIRFGQPVVTGDLDRAIVRRYVHRSFRKLDECYASARDPKLEGVVTVELTIGENGTVTSSKASGLAKLDGCVAGVISAIQFPKPKSEVQVVYPISFKPPSPPAAKAK